MPIIKRRNNDGEIISDWQPEGEPKAHSLNLPQGGGERSRPELIEINVGRVVHEHIADGVEDLASYILSQIDNNVRLNPIRILIAADLPDELVTRIAARIKYKLMQRKREEPE